MTAPYPVEALANAILEKAENLGNSVDPMKLQKLVYLANGHHAGKTGRVPGGGVGAVGK